MEHTLVILPGWGGSQETWQDFIDLAKKKFLVFCIDLPCFGSEPCPVTPWGVKEYADFVLKKIQEKKLISVILLGHSFGGQIAAYIAIHHPEAISSLILVGAAAIRPQRRFKRAIFFTLAKAGSSICQLPVIRRLEPRMRKILYTSIHSLDYYETSGIKRAIFQNIVHEDLADQLTKIQSPTLVVWGTKDSYVPLKLGKKIHTSIPGSFLHVIRGGRHGLHHTHKEEMLDVIQQFLDRKSTLC